jgi:arylsulfatase A-like enzyme
VMVDDVMPTLLEATRVAARPDGKPACDGVSFVPMLRETAAGQQDRPLYWHYPHIWGPTGPGIGPFSAVRQGDWKLIYYHADRRFELFNVTEDLGETRNRLADQPAVARRLAQTLSDWFRTVDAQMPTDRRTGRPVPLPDEALQRAASSP